MCVNIKVVVIKIDNSVKVILCNSIIHIDIGKRRNSDDEDVYESQLRLFASDRDYGAIVAALEKRDYVRAGRYSQRLKIKSYNLGMVRLAKKCDTLCLAILSGKGAPDFKESMTDVTAVYGMMQECIERAFGEKTEKPDKHRTGM